MPPAILGHGAGQGSTTLAAASAFDSTGATGLYVFVGYFAPGPIVVSDTYGNTWTLEHTAAGVANIAVYSCSSPTTGSGHVVQVSSGSPTYPVIFALAASGTAGYSFTAFSDAQTSGASTIAPGALTPSASNALLLYALASGGGGASVDIGTGLDTEGFIGGTSFAGMSAYAMLATPSSWNPTFSYSPAYSTAVIGVLQPSSLANGISVDSAAQFVITASQPAVSVDAAAQFVITASQPAVSVDAAAQFVVTDKRPALSIDYAAQFVVLRAVHSYTASLSDSISGTDGYSAAREVHGTLSDSLTTADSFSFATPGAGSITDTSAVVDSYSAVLLPAPPSAPAVSIDDYLELVTSEHRTRARFIETVKLVCQGHVDNIWAVLSLSTAFDLDTAVGSQLDVVGEWVGVSRFVPEPLVGVYFSLDSAPLGLDLGYLQGPYDPTQGLVELNDATFRLLLRARIASNNWDGTIPSAMRALLTLFANSETPGAQIFIQDDGGMRMTFAAAGQPPGAAFLSILANGLLGLKPSGVGADYIQTSVASAPLFGLDVSNGYIDGLDVGALGVVIIP